MAIWSRSRFSARCEYNGKINYLVSFADLSDNILLGNLDVVKAQQTRRRSLDSELRVDCSVFIRLVDV